MEIFISYRREDTSGYALGFRREFAKALPDAEVFLDGDSIDSGTRWRDAIRARVRSCDVMLILIGDEWLRRRDGVEKLEDAADAVRFELTEALRRSREVSIIPVLVEEAQMPASLALPADVRGICEFNAPAVHDRSYDHDLNELVGRLRRLALHEDQPSPDFPLPSRVTERYLKETVPGMGRERVLEMITALHGRGWSSDEIYDYALGFSPLRPPNALPGRITPAWLAENVPLMNPQRLPKVVKELKRRRWSDDEI